MADLAVVILTYNEQKHIERCIRSALPVAQQVVVVDSFSGDRTPQIAESLGAEVHQNPWTNHATQLKWALEHVPIAADWIMRLDADEYITDALAAELSQRLSGMPQDCSALTVQRRMHFLGRWIKHGGVGERSMLRIWRNGKARCEQRWMDEHMIIENGQVMALRGAIVDDNLNSLTWWIDKHNTYASREVIDRLLRQSIGRDAADSAEASFQSSPQAARVRWLKNRVYYRVPCYARASLYFAYRMFVRLGLLDGRRGLFFHFMQGWWYRMLVDAKLYEVQWVARTQGLSLHEVVKARLGFDVPELKDAPNTRKT
jgi:glycosyltransferase involved in cell wall biosynthesis